MSTTLLSLALLSVLAPPVEVSENPETLLFVRTKPAGAKVLLDGKPLGTSDDLFRVEPGVRRIVIELEGHAPQAKELTVRVGEVTRIVLQLKKQPAVAANGPAVERWKRAIAEEKLARKRDLSEQQRDEERRRLDRIHDIEREYRRLTWVVEDREQKIIDRRAEIEEDRVELQRLNHKVAYLEKYANIIGAGTTVPLVTPEQVQEAKLLRNGVQTRISENRRALKAAEQLWNKAKDDRRNYKQKWQEILARDEKESDEFSFGPVVERTLGDAGAGGKGFIDFETGNLFAPPPKLWKDADAESAWCKEKGIDASILFGQVRDGVPSVLAVCGVDLGLRPVSRPVLDVLWQQSGEEFEELLDRHNPSRGTFTPLAVLSSGTGLPATFVFATDEHAVGILQVVSLAADKHAARIRYKLLGANNKTPEGAALAKRARTPRQISGFMLKELPEIQKTTAGRRAILASPIESLVTELAEIARLRFGMLPPQPPSLTHPVSPLNTLRTDLRVQTLVAYGSSSDEARKEVVQKATIPIRKYADDEDGHPDEWKWGYDALLLVLSFLKHEDSLRDTLTAYERLQASYENPLDREGWKPTDHGHNRFFYVHWDMALLAYAARWDDDGQAPRAPTSVAVQYRASRREDQKMPYACGGRTIEVVNPWERCVLVRDWILEFKRAMQEAGEWPGAGVIESQVLIHECGKLVGDALEAQRKAGRPLPELGPTKGFRSNVIEALQMKAPKVFRVTPEQEKRFAAGKFDDAAATKRLQETIKKLTDHKGDLPVTCKLIVKQFRTGKLHGGKLEVASRVMNAQLAWVEEGNTIVKSYGLLGQMRPSKNIAKEPLPKEFVKNLSNPKEIGPSPRVEKLLSQLGDHRVHVRRNTVGDLWRRSGPEIDAALARRLIVERDSNIRLALRKALALRGDLEQAQDIYRDFCQGADIGWVLGRVFMRPYGNNRDVWEKFFRYHSVEQLQEMVNTRLARESRDPDAWNAYETAVKKLQHEGNRLKAAELFDVVHRNFSDPLYASQARELSEQLRKMVAEDRQWQEPDDVASLDTKQKIEYHIFHLRDLFIRRDRMDPTRVSVFARQPDGAANPAVELHELGDLAIPALLALLDDRRPMRTVGYPFGPRNPLVLRYQDAAMQILDALLGERFYRYNLSDNYFSNEPAELRAEFIAWLRAYWKSAADKDPIERKWIAVRSDAGIYQSLRLLESLAAEVGQREEVLAELRHMCDWRHWAYQPKIALKMAELGDRSKVAEVLENADRGRYVRRSSLWLPDDGCALLNAEEAVKQLGVMSALAEIGQPKEAAEDKRAWSKPVKGLRWRISLPSERIESGRSLIVDMEFQNVSDKPLRILKTPTIRENLYPVLYTSGGNRDTYPIEHLDHQRIESEKTVLIEPGKTYRAIWKCDLTERNRPTGPAKLNMRYFSPKNANPDPDVANFWAGQLEQQERAFTIVPSGGATPEKKPADAEKTSPAPKDTKTPKDP